jgi:hypothetical protein
MQRTRETIEADLCLSRQQREQAEALAQKWKAHVIQCKRELSEMTNARELSLQLILSNVADLLAYLTIDDTSSDDE